VEAARGASDNRHEGNRVGGFLQVSYNEHGRHVSCQQQLHLVAYLCHQVEGNADDIKKRVRATPPTLVRDAQVEDQGHRPRGIRQVSCELAASTPLKLVSNFLNRPVVSLLGSRIGGTCTNMINKVIKSQLFGTSRGRQCDEAAICAHTASANNVCHRLSDQHSLIPATGPDRTKPRHWSCTINTRWGHFLPGRKCGISVRRRDVSTVARVVATTVVWNRCL
jgi:hypothetical protein